MRKHLLLLTGVVLLYLISALGLQAVYGPSYGLWSGDDRWEPDGEGGWIKRGNPQEPPPDQPSVYIPIGLLYLPIFLPAALLVLFMFTPLSRKLESRPEPEETLPDSSDQDQSGGASKAADDEESRP